MRSNRSAAAAGAVLALLAAAGCGGRKTPAAEPPVATAGEVRLEISRAWVRDGGKNRFGPNRSTGDLRFYDDRVEFLDTKRGWVLRYEAVRRLSLGTLEGDVDSDWIVLDADDPAVGDHVAFRDGKRFGFAPRTPEWYATVKALLQEARAAQFAAPDGFDAFGALERQLSFVHPESWDIEVLDTELRDGVNVGGAFRLHGASSSDVVVERRPDAGRKWCPGIPPQELEALAAELASSQRYADLEPGSTALETSSLAVDHCSGVRFRGRGPSRETDIVAVSNAGTLFLLALRCPGTCSETERAEFETMVGSVRFPDARPHWAD